MPLSSALKIGPHSDEVWSIEMKMAMRAIRDLSINLNGEVSVILQHNLQKDLFAVMAEAGPRTFSGVDANFHSAWVKLRHNIEKFLRSPNEELQPAPKPTPRETSGQGSRRSGSTRKRSHAVRQGGRASSR